MADDISSMFDFSQTDFNFQNMADTSALQRQSDVSSNTISNMMDIPSSTGTDFTTSYTSPTTDFTGGSAGSSDFLTSTDNVTGATGSYASSGDQSYGDFSPRSDGQSDTASTKSKKPSLFSGGKAASVPSVSGPKLPPISVSTPSASTNRDYSGMLDELLAKYKGRNIPNFNF